MEFNERYSTKFRKIAQKVIDERKAKLDAENKKKQEKAEREEREDLQKANDIIVNIDNLATEAAKDGQFSVTIMKDLGYNDVENGMLTYKTRKSNIAMKVMQHCTSVGLKPTIEYWHDGVGTTGGYTLDIHW